MPLQFSPFRGNENRPRTIYPIIVIPVLALVLIAGTLTVYLKGFAQAVPPDTLVPFRGTVPSSLADSKLVGPANANQTITLSIGLRLRNVAALNSYVKDISRPDSVNFHRYLAPAQFIQAFAPTKATYDAVLQYLQGSGFTIVHTYKHRMLISFTGTVGLTEQVFHGTINNYTAPNGEAFYSNNSDPLLPASFVAQVQVISGLNNAVHWHHAPLSRRSLPAQTTASSTNAVTCLGHGSGYYTPDQTASAYNLNGLYNAGYNGEGQTLALFELATFQMSDLTTYASCYGHSHTPIYTITIPNEPASTDSGVAEVELDAELVLSAAPKLGQLKIYEASNNGTGYNDEWAQIIQDDPPVVSTSWGSCEADLGQGEAVYENNNFFMAAAAQGQSIFAAAGDTGSSGCLRGSGSQALSAGDPAAQPFVTGVGGTTLTLNGSAYGSETVWNNQTGASGGGISQYWSIPSWQGAPGVQNQYSNGNREEPDVALNADPNAAYIIYCSSAAAGCTQPGFYGIGGTSAATPMWAAMMAMTNEESVKKGGFNLGFINPLLYQIASSGSYGNDFQDVPANGGNNDFNNLQGGKYPTTTAYDMATGLGSYNAANLAADMVAKAQNGQRAAPANTTWYFAEGSVGGGFQEYLTLQNPSTTQTANVSVTYLIQGSAARTIAHTVSASSRSTIDVDSDLGDTPTGPHLSVAAIVQVTNNVGIVAERPMYFNVLGVHSGTDVVGATAPGKSYYFSEADETQSGSASYHTFLTMLNPSGTTTAHVAITYYTGSCGGTGQAACPVESITVPPLTRQTASPDATGIGLHQKLAIGVVSDQNVVIERPMYFTDNVPNSGLTTGAASEVGATQPGLNWLFAEGYTGSGFQEYYELANFDQADAHVNINLEYTNGVVHTFPVTVPAQSHVAFDVNAHFSNGATNSVSAQITSTDNPIVADRLMYFHFGGAHISGGTDVVGTPAANNVYTFAEGYTGGAFSEFLTLQNPTGNSETVAVTLFTQGSQSFVFQEQVVVGAHTRSTININTLLNPMGAGSVSMAVQALSGTIVAERPMYFIFQPAGISSASQGGTNVIGYTGG
jgi:pro-kumamolisin-like protein